MASLLKSGAARAAVRYATTASRAPVAGSVTFARGKATLPDLPYDYGALEPSISGKIMELHHKKHHQTYVNGYNDAVAKLSDAVSAGDIKSQISLQPLIKFHGGGHTNHSLFWENLAPSKNGGGGAPSGSLSTAINETFGDFDKFKTKMNTTLAAIQGSGWAWLVKDPETGKVSIQAYANQDPVTGAIPLLGIDAWEHAYYLQYQNRKAEYFSAIWDVINWKTVEKRFA